MKKEEVGNNKQSTLVKTLLDKSYAAHNSLEDVKILYELFVPKMTCYSEDLFPHSQPSKVVLTFRGTDGSVFFNSRKIAGSVLGLKHICLAHMRDKLCGVKAILGEPGVKGKVVYEVLKYLHEQEE